MLFAFGPNSHHSGPEQIAPARLESVASAMRSINDSIGSKQRQQHYPILTVEFSARKDYGKHVHKPMGRLRQRRLFRPDETDGCL